jgi:hypothetical protein
MSPLEIGLIILRSAEGRRADMEGEVGHGFRLPLEIGIALTSSSTSSDEAFHVKRAPSSRLVALFPDAKRGKDPVEHVLDTYSARQPSQRLSCPPKMLGLQLGET